MRSGNRIVRPEGSVGVTAGDPTLTHGANGSHGTNGSHGSHGTSIVKVATAGITGGTTPETYSSARPGTVYGWSRRRIGGTSDGRGGQPHPTWRQQDGRQRRPTRRASAV